MLDSNNPPLSELLESFIDIKKLECPRVDIEPYADPLFFRVRADLLDIHLSNRRLRVGFVVSFWSVPLRVNQQILNTCLSREVDKANVALGLDAVFESIVGMCAMGTPVPHRYSGLNPRRIFLLGRFVQIHNQGRFNQLTGNRCNDNRPPRSDLSARTLDVTVVS